MERDLVKRFIKKDGSQRISFYRDEYAENPRYTTDEPLHCEDWSRDYSIMNKQEREYEKCSCSDRLRILIGLYGNKDAIIELLKANGKDGTHTHYENALMYDRSTKEWLLKSWQPSWKDYQGNVYDAHWKEEASFCCKFNDIELYDLTDYLSDEQIDTICSEDMFTNKVKIMSYGFGYDGNISFYHEFSTDSEGICWLEKDEFLKYSGCKDEYWNGKSLDEIDAWSNNEVYGFVVEDCIKSKVHKEYTNVDKEDEDFEEEDWEESDSCWGFYGELDKVEDDMFESAGLNKEEFEEENV